MWGAIVGTLTLIITVVGSASALYWKAGVHMNDATIHIMESDGVPVVVKRAYETAIAAGEARTALVRDIEKKMATQHDDLKVELVKAIAPQRYERWAAQQEKQKAQEN